MGAQQQEDAKRALMRMRDPASAEPAPIRPACGADRFFKTVTEAQAKKPQSASDRFYSTVTQAQAKARTEQRDVLGKAIHATEPRPARTRTPEPARPATSRKAAPLIAPFEANPAGSTGSTVLVGTARDSGRNYTSWPARDGTIAAEQRVDATATERAAGRVGTEHVRGRGMPELWLAQRNPEANTGQHRLARSASAPRSRRPVESADPRYGDPRYGGPRYGDCYASDRACARDGVLQYSPWGGWTFADPRGHVLSADLAFDGGAATWSAATFADLPTPHERAAWQQRVAWEQAAQTSRRPPLRGTPNPHVVARPQVLPARGLSWGAGTRGAWHAPSRSGGGVRDSRAERERVNEAWAAWHGECFAGGWSEEVPTWERGWREVPSSSGWEETPRRVPKGAPVGGARKLRGPPERAAAEGPCPPERTSADGRRAAGDWERLTADESDSSRRRNRRAPLSGELQAASRKLSNSKPAGLMSCHAEGHAWSGVVETACPLGRRHGSLEPSLMSAAEDGQRDTEGLLITAILHLLPPVSVDHRPSPLIASILR